jgi:hypothetical protein
LGGEDVEESCPVSEEVGEEAMMSRKAEPSWCWTVVEGGYGGAGFGAERGCPREGI